MSKYASKVKILNDRTLEYEESKYIKIDKVLPRKTITIPLALLFNLDENVLIEELFKVAKTEPYPNRLVNLLARNDIKTTSDLKRYSLSQLSYIKGFGVGLRKVLLESLISYCTIVQNLELNYVDDEEHY